RFAQRAAAKRPPRVSYGFLFKVFHVCLVVSIVPVVVVTRPNPLPAPWGRLPSPARAGIETNADGEWHRREGEAAMTEPVEASKAWCKCWAAGSDEPTTQTGAAEASAHHRTTEASTHPAAKASTHPAAEASAYHCAAEGSASHSAAKASTHHPAVK